MMNYCYRNLNKNLSLVGRTKTLLTAMGLAITSGVTAKAQTISTFDVLVATGNLTVVGTTTIQGNQLSVGTTALAVQDGRVAIGTTTVGGLFHIVTPAYLSSETDEFLLTLPWNALRYGQREGAEWSQLNAGERTVALGGFNHIARHDSAAILGGWENASYSPVTFIAGGANQVIQDSVTTSQYSASIGGFEHLISGAAGAFIAGGYQNSILRGDYSAILGGIGNIAMGDFSTVIGGEGNIASGRNSFAAGSFANAAAPGTFVWADTQAEELLSNTTDEFKIRAQGGFVFYSTHALPTIIVSSGSIMISTSASAARAVPNVFISSINGNVGIGTQLPATTLDVNGSAQLSSAQALSKAHSLPRAHYYWARLAVPFTA